MITYLVMSYSWGNETVQSIQIKDSTNSKNSYVKQQNTVEFNGHEYTLVTISKPWIEAKADCESQGGHLVTITSQEENDFVVSLLGSETVWIGLTDEQNEGVWQWVTGETVTYTNWDPGPGEPNGGTSENYAEMYSNGLWNDASGDWNYYVCERIHQLTISNVIYLNGGEILKDITIQWTPSHDSLNHDVTYEVYYSTNNGITWNLLASGLTTTSYDWNTTFLNEGIDFMIKVLATCNEGLSAEDTSDNTFSIHYLTNPAITSPHNGETIRNNFSIQWSESFESLGNNVTYTVFYSADNGNNWHSITTGCTSTSYEWNTSTIPDESNYKLKIVATSSENLTREFIFESTFKIDNIPPNYPFLVIGLALIVIIPELFIGRKLSHILSRNNIQSGKGLR